MIPAPFAYPRDPRYVAAATALRAARADWFAACAEPIVVFDLWRCSVDNYNRHYQDALRAVRDEEDRIDDERTAERAYLATAAGAVARGGRFGAARKATS